MPAAWILASPSRARFTFCASSLLGSGLGSSALGSGLGASGALAMGAGVTGSAFFATGGGVESLQAARAKTARAASSCFMTGLLLQEATSRSWRAASAAMENLGQSVAAAPGRLLLLAHREVIGDGF